MADALGLVRGVGFRDPWEYFLLTTHKKRDGAKLNTGQVTD